MTNIELLFPEGRWIGFSAGGTFAAEKHEPSCTRPDQALPQIMLGVLF